jgi:glutamine amidotransferase-like uncharacterized protein
MENQDNTNKETGHQKAGGLIFVGCMFIGMAAGWYFGNIKVGMFGGMGIGFLLMAVTVLSAATKK